MSDREVRRVAGVIRLRPDREEQYVALHAAVPAPVLETLRAAHMTNYSIFVRDGLLFSYLEYTGDDYDADSARIAADPATRAWWRRTDPLQEPVSTAARGQW